MSANRKQETDSYWLRHPNDRSYIKIDRLAYVKAERDQGFRNTMNRPAEPATSAFTGPDGIQGTTIPPERIQELPRRFAADHEYYGPAGEPITLTQWAEHMRTDRVLREDPINVTGDLEAAVLKTLYLGLVMPTVDCEGLYGTAVIMRERDGRPAIDELQQYSTATEAYLGHLDHYEAIVLGHHCHFCRTRQPHRI